ncbi:FkbM family methyltransferase [Fuerstiella marisgermanici]|uniref:Methyltransferase, FkbM family n=1 Tax=Fuerstiella marisgermanici TaxID=1891926 RepID=A0A1P8WN43_9PLAN|nr:FkbM family methyltransferase [Fuerstiella marisgermanici]APZ95461.1 methyltransferase, FkbM family [Fuerstiella marisgermanici]
MKTAAWPRVKRVVAAILCSNAMGKLVSWIYRDRIPWHGIVVNVADPAVLPRNKAALRFGFYESAERRFVKRYLLPDVDVVELGSSIGAMSSQIAQRLQAGARMICVEANPRTQTTLTKNLDQNAAGLQVELIHAAIAYDGVDVEIGLSENNLSSFRERDASDVQRVMVPAVTLSNLLRQSGMETYQLVADIEGAEAEILMKDGDALKNCSRVIIELHDTSVTGVSYCVAELVSMFEALGFTILDEYGPVAVFENRRFTSFRALSA